MKPADLLVLIVSLGIGSISLAAKLCERDAALQPTPAQMTLAEPAAPVHVVKASRRLAIEEPSEDGVSTLDGEESVSRKEICSVMEAAVTTALADDRATDATEEDFDSACHCGKEN